MALISSPLLCCVSQEPVAAGMLLSCVLSINRSLWNSCVKRATSWPAASVTCPPTKITGMRRGHIPTDMHAYVHDAPVTCQHSYTFLSTCSKMQTEQVATFSRINKYILLSVLCVNFKSQRWFTCSWFLVCRLVHVGKALQDQRWLLQNLMARVEEKRSAVESTAKQIQGRWDDIAPIPPPWRC